MQPVQNLYKMAEYVHDLKEKRLINSKYIEFWWWSKHIWCWSEKAIEELILDYFLAESSTKMRKDTDERVIVYMTVRHLLCHWNGVIQIVDTCLPGTDLDITCDISGFQHVSECKKYQYQLRKVVWLHLSVWRE